MPHLVQGAAVYGLRVVSMVKAGVAALAIVLLVTGAAGFSTLAGDECGAAAVVEGTSWRWTLTVWPPGGECVYSLPGGETRTVPMGSVTWWFALVALGLGVAAWTAWRWPAVPRPARVAALTMLAMCFSGLGALLGGLQSALVLGFLIGLPVAMAVARAAIVDAVAVAAALVAAATLSLLGLGVEAFPISLVAVTLVAAASPGGNAVHLAGVKPSKPLR